MLLHALAHTRSGDKGNTANLSVIAYEKSNYPRLARYLTAERVKAHLAPHVRGAVERYLMPGVGALNFVLHDTLRGGVTRSRAIDPHGKSLGSALLTLDIPDDA